MFALERTEHEEVIRSAKAVLEILEKKYEDASEAQSGDSSTLPNIGPSGNLDAASDRFRNLPYSQEDVEAMLGRLEELTRRKNRTAIAAEHGLAVIDGLRKLLPLVYTL